MIIKILYDNELFESSLKSDWGFSALIDDKILFDTGADGKILLKNMNKLNIDTRKIEKIILSHQHYDHTNGIFSLLKINKNLTIYLLKSFTISFKTELGKNANVIEVNKPLKITENIFTTGEIGNTIKEQSLILTTKNGVVLITGCSHSGIDNILNSGKEKGNIYGIIGGMHNFKDYKLLKNLKIISPLHCTSHKEAIKDLYPKSFVLGGVGKEFEV